MPERAPKTPVKMRTLRTRAVKQSESSGVRGGIGMLLPAVQAAREAARRTS